MRINNIKLRYKLAIIYLITGFLPNRYIVFIFICTDEKDIN